jgi:UDP-N-acetylmuramate dehydrogenase
VAATFSRLTSLAVGGRISRLLEPTTVPALIDAVRDAWEDDDWLLLGGGSNLLVADEGFEGTVVHVLTRGIEHDGTTLRVQAGEPWEAVVDYAVRNGLAGIEALSGIPGSAGAGPIQNIGAYGQELSSRLVAIEFLDHASGALQRVAAADLELGYRSSAMKRGLRGLVVSIELALERPVAGLGAPVAYEQLAAALGVGVGERVALAEVRSAVLALRAAKGMLLSGDDPDSVSAGSFFTNPIVSENFARSLPADAPRWLLDPDAPQTSVKISAAWLIERAGIRRGFSLPGSHAAISGKHTLAIVNTGGASAAEIAQLARYVQQRVANDFGVILQPEPVLVGVQL